MFASRILYTNSFNNESPLAPLAFDKLHETATSVHENILTGHKPFERLSYRVASTYLDIYPQGKDGDPTDHFDFKVDLPSTVGLGAMFFLGDFDTDQTIRAGLTPVFNANANGEGLLNLMDSAATFEGITGGSILLTGNNGSDYTEEEIRGLMVGSDTEFTGFHVSNQVVYFAPDQERQDRLTSLNPDPDKELVLLTSGAELEKFIDYYINVNDNVTALHENIHRFDSREQWYGKYVEELAESLLNKVNINISNMPEWISFRGFEALPSYGFSFLTDAALGFKEHDQRVRERLPEGFDQYYNAKIKPF